MVLDLTGTSVTTPWFSIDVTGTLESLYSGNRLKSGVPLRMVSIHCVFRSSIFLQAGELSGCTLIMCLRVQYHPTQTSHPTSSKLKSRAIFALLSRLRAIRDLDACASNLCINASVYPMMMKRKASSAPDPDHIRHSPLPWHSHLQSSSSEYIPAPRLTRRNKFAENPQAQYLSRLPGASHRYRKL